MQTQAKKNNIFKRIIGTDEFSVAVPLLAVVLLMVILSIFVPRAKDWYGLQNISAIFTMFPYIGLTSLAAAFPLLTGNVDISTGRLVGFSTMFAAAAVTDWAWNPGMAAVGAILITSLFGILNGLLVVKIGVPDFVATMGTLYISGGCRYLLFQGYELNMTLDPESAARAEGVINFFSNETRFLGLPMNFWIVLAIFIIAAIIIKKTLFGRRLLACGDNREVAALAGINVTKYRLIAYYICAFLCGIAGVIFVFNQGVGRPSTGDGWEFRAIAGCVVGGTSLAGGKCSPISVFIGVFLVMSVENALLFFPEVIPSTMQMAVRGIIMAVAVLWDMYRQNKKVKA